MCLLTENASQMKRPKKTPKIEAKGETPPGSAQGIKMKPNWSQNDPQMGAKWSQNGSKMDLKGSKIELNGPKKDQNRPKMELKKLIGPKRT